jgi:O-antigen ligase
MAFGQRRWWTALVGSGCLLLVALACGRLVVETQSIDAATLPLLLGTVAALAAVGVMFIGPVASVAAVAGLSMVTQLPSLPIVPGVDVRPADAFYVGLLGWTVSRLVQPAPVRESAPTLRSAPILVLLGFAGLTLLYVVAVDPGAAQGSFVSWLRIVQTVSVGFLTAFFLASTRDVKVVLATVAVAGVAIVVIGITGIAAGADASDRVGGVAGPNTVGLISGLLMLMAVVGALGPQLVYRLPLGIVAGVGLVEAKSIGSIVATSVAVILALGLASSTRRGVAGLRAAKLVIAVLVALGLAYGVASAVRPGDLPGSEGFRSSSAWHRTVVGSAGVELALRHPVIGVGWRRSSSPDVIGDPDIATDLRARFSTTKEEFFPDVEPTSVHNSYVQVAADLGFVGLALLIVVLWTLGRDIGRLIRRVPANSELWRLLWFLAWGIVLILIWLNDNPLFGGQAETVLLAVLVGAIAGLGGGPALAQAHAQAARAPSR